MKITRETLQQIIKEEVAKEKQLRQQQSQALLEQQKLKPIIQKKKKVEQEIERNYSERHIFVLADDQDLLAEDLKFTYVEINHRLAKFVSDKVWRSQAAQRLTLNEKIELGKPSKDLMEQCMLEILDEVSTRMGEQYEAAFLLGGQPMRTPL